MWNFLGNSFEKKVCTLYIIQDSNKDSKDIHVLCPFEINVNCQNLELTVSKVNGQIQIILKISVPNKEALVSFKAPIRTRRTYKICAPYKSIWPARIWMYQYQWLYSNHWQITMRNPKCHSKSNFNFEHKDVHCTLKLNRNSWNLIMG